MNSFISSWLHRFPKRERHNSGYQQVDINNLILDLALSSNINEFLIRYLEDFQSIISDKIQGEVFLVSPSLSIKKPQFLYADSVQPSDELLKELSYKLSLETHSPKEQFRVSLSERAHSAHFQKISYGAKGAVSWLVVSFEDTFPSNEVINYYTKSVVAFLERGFSAWYKQQTKIQDSIEAVKNSHAAELHDTLVQTLGYLRIKSSSLVEQSEKTGDHHLRTVSQDISDQIKLAYRQSRDLVSTSKLNVLEGTLIKMILESITEFEQRTGIVFEFDNRVGMSVQTPNDTQVLYIVREAVSNIVRHSHASHARITVKKINKSLFFRIEDNGKGIANDLIRHDSFGMKIMKERAEKLSADLSILPRSHGGTCIELKVVEY